MTSGNGLEHWVKTFKSVDWLIPAYIQMGFLSKCAAQIEQAADDDKGDVFRAIGEAVYNEDHLASMLLGLYSRTSFVKDYRQHINEAIEAAFFGLDHAAVATLIPVIEGTIRKLAISQGRNVGFGTKKLIAELDLLIEKENNSPNRFGERIAMWTMLRDFFEENLLEKTEQFAGRDQFNRHGILHGIFDRYGDRSNFYRCITIIELLCFTMIFFYGGSVFAPEETPESKQLAQHYTTLKLMARKAAGVRSIVAK